MYGEEEKFMHGVDRLAESYLWCVSHLDNQIL